MAGKTKTLTPDIVLKNYWDNREHFADLFNAVLFGGQQVIRPQDLEDEDTVNSSFIGKGQRVTAIRATRKETCGCVLLLRK